MLDHLHHVIIALGRPVIEVLQNLALLQPGNKVAGKQY